MRQASEVKNHTHPKHQNRNHHPKIVIAAERRQRIPSIPDTNFKEQPNYLKQQAKDLAADQLVGRRFLLTP